MIYAVVACSALFGLVQIGLAFRSLTDRDYGAALRSILLGLMILLLCWIVFKQLRGEGKGQ